MRAIHVVSLVFLGLRSLLGAEQGPQRPVDLNSATVTELMQLPRVGARTAERIVKFRKEHGPFKRVEEVMNVQGIGEKSFTRLRPHLTVAHAGVGERTASVRR